MAKQKAKSEGEVSGKYDRDELFGLSAKIYSEWVAKQGTAHARQMNEVPIKDCIFLAKQFLNVFEAESSGEEA